MIACTSLPAGSCRKHQAYSGRSQNLFDSPVLRLPVIRGHLQLTLYDERTIELPTLFDEGDVQSANSTMHDDNMSQCRLVLG